MNGNKAYTLEEFDKWLDSVDEPNVLWLTGSPRAGKFAIASSTVSKLLARGNLSSRFFFKRGDAVVENLKSERLMYNGQISIYNSGS
jgi:adenylylsulfate kinase-like enzyme